MGHTAMGPHIQTFDNTSIMRQLHTPSPITTPILTNVQVEWAGHLVQVNGLPMSALHDLFQHLDQAQNTLPLPSIASLVHRVHPLEQHPQTPTVSSQCTLLTNSTMTDDEDDWDIIPC